MVTTPQACREQLESLYSISIEVARLHELLQAPSSGTPPTALALALDVKRRLEVSTHPAEVNSAYA